MPQTNAIHAAIIGNAKSVGNTRTTINAAKIAKPTKSKMPDTVKIKSSSKKFASPTKIVVVEIVSESFHAVKNFSTDD